MAKTNHGSAQHSWVKISALVLMAVFISVCGLGSIPAEGKDKAVSNTTKTVLPARMIAEAFPARIAFTRGDRLWVLDGYCPGAKPVRVLGKAPVAGLVGWSPNGQYLAYLQNQSKKKYGEELYLWVVRADGTQPRQISSNPICGRAAWSPTALTLAYQTYSGRQDYTPDALKLTSRMKGSFKTTTLLIDKSGDVNDFTWYPDGKSLAVAYRKTKTRQLAIDRVTLSRKHTRLYTLEQPGADSYFYTSAASALSISPDGRYLGYHLEPNSASIAADGTAGQALDLQKCPTIQTLVLDKDSIRLVTKKGGAPRDLGSGLHYPQWMAWTTEGRLAYIAGGGREATTGKSLEVVSMNTGQIKNAGQPGMTDTQPVWSSNNLYFCRGPETLAWEGNEHKGVLVPGQRIFRRDPAGGIRAFTVGPANTADYYPMPALNGSALVFLRLTDRYNGSLYTMNSAGGPAKELVRGITCGYDYYGNYYPEWVKIFWN